MLGVIVDAILSVHRGAYTGYCLAAISNDAVVVVPVSVVIVAVRLTLGSLVVCLSLSSMADCWRLLFLVILLIV